jgi:hypothetical protein
MRKEWQTPELQVLTISKTMAGEGTHYVDWTYHGGKLDLDITDDPSSGIPVPVIPGVPTS